MVVVELEVVGLLLKQRAQLLMLLLLVWNVDLGDEICQEGRPFIGPFIRQRIGQRGGGLATWNRERRRGLMRLRGRALRWLW